MIKSLISPKSYLASIGIVLLVAAICYPFTNLIGYRAVALLLLFTVSIISLKFELYPVLLAAFLSALLWDFFFIPPHFTLYVGNAEDALMLSMYFVIALLNGVFSARIKRFEALAKQKEDRANAVKLYDTLFQSVSHELRTPIATILGASDTLIESQHISGNNKIKLYQQINLASIRLNRLVESLLNMSRLESGSMKPKLEWCDLGDLISSVINRLENEQPHQRNISVSIEQGMPLFKIDFGLIEQALYNILHNAITYTPENAQITINGFYQEQQCNIVIEDTGKGFPKQDLATVFEKLYRTKGSKTGGLGLGLSISKGFINAHRGTIKVENIKSGGAKFSIQIPAETCSPNDIFFKRNHE
jgi:two-component system, OmpR family, sensor histidine kinase KdpD